MTQFTRKDVESVIGGTNIIATRTDNTQLNITNLVKALLSDMDAIYKEVESAHKYLVSCGYAEHGVCDAFEPEAAMAEGFRDILSKCAKWRVV